MLYVVAQESRKKSRLQELLFLGLSKSKSRNKEEKTDVAVLSHDMSCTEVAWGHGVTKVTKIV